MVTYREMLKEDVQALARLEEDNFPHPWSEQSLLKEVDREESLFVVAEADGTVAGYAGMYLIGDEGDITNLVVDSACRNRGIGHGLMKYLLDKAENKGIKAVTLEVRVSNAGAIRLYEAHGFVSQGIRPGFYDSPREDAMIMWYYLP